MPDITFTSIKIWQTEIPFRLSFSHNLATRDSAETLLIAITTSGGHTGYGQALPRTYLTGETIESAVEAIRFHWKQLSEISLPSFADMDQAMEALAPVFAYADSLRQNGSYAALDIAALDAFARERGIPATIGSGNAGEPCIKLVAAIPAASPKKAARLARILHWLGYRRFKVKVGKDAAADRARLEAVRKIIGPDLWLAADANQAWEMDEAVTRMGELASFGINLMEEPLQREIAMAADFPGLERKIGIPVMADESLCTLADAEALLRRGSPSWWNIRLAKNGGMTGISRFYRLAHENGILLYGGILVGETGLLAAAAQHSLFGNGVECAEYGFPRVFLRGDPFRGGPGGYFGCLGPPREKTPGLGISLNTRLLCRNAKLLFEL